MAFRLFAPRFATNHLGKWRFCVRIPAQKHLRILFSTQPDGEPQRVCQGMNYLKEGSDPPLLPDSEYPDWLWDLLKPKEPVDVDLPDLTNKAYWRRKNKIERRKENAARKGKKF